MPAQPSPIVAPAMVHPRFPALPQGMCDACLSGLQLLQTDEPPTPQTVWDTEMLILRVYDTLGLKTMIPILMPGTLRDHTSY